MTSRSPASQRHDLEARVLKFMEMVSQKSNQPKPGPSRPKQQKQPPQYRAHPPRPPAGAPEVVDPVWLLKAIGITLAAALACGYASLCLLLYQGQWQLILHPKQTTFAPATIGSTPINMLRFGTDDSGTPQLTGWAIPATPGSKYAGITVLFLPPGDGSLADTAPILTTLHELGVNLFAVDYRGYGQSVSIHPNQLRMMQDADTAFQYLVTSRAIPQNQIVVYGQGVGASLATHLAAEHPEMPALILDSPEPDPLTAILHDPRTRFLPVKALIHDRFPLAEPLTTLKTPKLLIQSSGQDYAFHSAGNPKMTIFDLPRKTPEDARAVLTGYLRRFFDQYLNLSIVQMPIPDQQHPSK